VGAFGDVLCAVTDEGTAIIDSKGKIRYIAPYKPLKLGTGDRPALIMGEETFIFNEKMEPIYSFENKYIPLNVITDKNAVMLFWQRAAQVHRK